MANKPSFQRIIPMNYVHSEQVGSDLPYCFSSPSTPANTHITNTLTIPNFPFERYQLAVFNPSTVSDMVVKVYNTITPAFGGSGQKDILVTSWTVSKATPLNGSGTNTDSWTTPVSGIFAQGASAKIVMANVAAIGAAITPYARLTAFR